MAMGWLPLKRLEKSSRSSMRATVYFAASLIMPAAPSGSIHSELKRISVLAGSRTLNTCAW